MPIAKYNKKPVTIHKEPLYKGELEVKNVAKFYDHNKEPVSVWDFMKNSYSEFIDMLVASRIIGFALPVILILVGVGLLHQEIWPEVEQQILEAEGYYEQGTTPLVQGDYIQERQLTLSNPGSEYFKSLTDAAFDEHVLKEDPISKNYSGNFSMSLPTIDLYDLPVQANVDSGSEEIYQSVLNTALAHMQGTGLPISNVDNNIVIYGHSARGDYYEQTQDVAGAFSRLQKLKIGDEITIEMDGETYKYKVYKTKIVQPTDVSIINGTPNKRTLTLFTCFPNGNPDKRLVVTARPVE